MCFFFSFRPKCLSWRNYYIQILRVSLLLQKRTKITKNKRGNRFESAGAIAPCARDFSFDSREFSAQKLQEGPLRTFREISLRYLNKKKKTEQKNGKSDRAFTHLTCK